MKKRILQKISLGMSIIMTVSQMKGMAVMAAPEEDGWTDNVELEDEFEDEFEDDDFGDIFEEKFEDENEFLEIKNENNNYQELDADLLYAEKATSGECGDNLTWNFDKDTRILSIHGTGEMYDFTQYTIPWKDLDIRNINLDEGITTIGDYAFYGNFNLPSISLPSTIKTIGNSAFVGCGLTKLVLHDGIETIGDKAFSCRVLSSISFGTGLKSIGKEAFSGCAVYNIEMPDINCCLAGDAFSSCDNLISIKIPSSIKVIDELSFYNCKSLTDVEILCKLDTPYYANFNGCESLSNIELPSYITVISAGEFGSCKSLTRIIIPDGVTTIERAAFNYCTNLTEIFIPDSVTTIGEKAFFFCKNLKEIKLPSGITRIEPETFAYCNDLTYVNIPENVSEVCENAYDYCGGVQYLVLPRSLKSVGTSAFRLLTYPTGEYKITDIYYAGTETDFSKIDVDGISIINGTSSIPITIHYNSYGPNDIVPLNPNPYPTDSNRAILKKENGSFVCYVDDNRDDNYSGYANYEDSMFFVEYGSIKTDLNGVMIDPNSAPNYVWYFCSNGQVQTQHVGLAEYDGEWFYIENGKVSVEMNAFVEYDGGLFAVGAGRIISEYSGLMQDPQDPVNGAWYYFAGGQAQTQYTGLAMYDNVWFYVVKGKLATDYTGTVAYDGATFNVTNGMVTTSESSGETGNTNSAADLSIEITNMDQFWGEYNRVLSEYATNNGWKRL